MSVYTSVYISVYMSVYMFGSRVDHTGSNRLNACKLPQDYIYSKIESGTLSVNPSEKAQNCAVKEPTQL